MLLDLKNVSIRYRTGGKSNTLLELLNYSRYKTKTKSKYFWAVRDVSFTLGHGDMLGIIGSNGSGKSTLLKAISGIMDPTEGKVDCRGKVTALLELVSGFDRELSVKENTYLRGALLGYTRDFVNSKYEEIIAFSELENFQNWPFKHLSSGMKARLALSISSLLEPEILVLDEVLAVGDLSFRRKSENKIREIINNGATTILVSHSLSQIKSMCNKILWLHKGKVVEYGLEVSGTCERYEAFQDGQLSID